MMSQILVLDFLKPLDLEEISKAVNGHGSNFHALSYERIKILLIFT